MAQTWPSKDPDEIKDYRWEPVLDTGDTISSISLTRIAGTVVTDSIDDDDTGITVFLSGGVTGETSVFEGRVVTTGGRTFEATLLLPVISSAGVGDLASGYVVPSPADLKQHYPAFAAVDDGTVQYWLTDAKKIVTDSWIEGDYASALMSLAAHNMARKGIGVKSATGGLAGVTSFKSGTFSASFSDAAANASVRGGYPSTAYGQEFVVFLRRNRGGPLTTRPGRVACCGDARRPSW